MHDHFTTGVAIKLMIGAGANNRTLNSSRAFVYATNPESIYPA
jgi:hypothetical protein